MGDGCGHTRGVWCVHASEIGGGRGGRGKGGGRMPDPIPRTHNQIYDPDRQQTWYVAPSAAAWKRALFWSNISRLRRKMVALWWCWREGRQMVVSVCWISVAHRHVGDWRPPFLSRPQTRSWICLDGGLCDCTRLPELGELPASTPARVETFRGPCIHTP